MPVQHGQGRARGQRLCSRWEHVREESQAAIGGKFSLTRPYHASHGGQWYRHAHAKDMPLRAIARMIQTMLYAKRFFPYYVYNILAGIEADGE